MLVRGSTMPSDGSFRIDHTDGAEKCTVVFFYNVRQEATQDGADKPSSDGVWEQYSMECTYDDRLQGRIEQSYAVYLEQAKEIEKQKAAVNLYQMNADVDFLMALNGMV